MAYTHKGILFSLSNEAVLSFGTSLMNLKVITVSKINRSLEDNWYMFLLIHRI